MDLPNERPRYPGEDRDAQWRRLVFPQDHRNPQPKELYHLAVIGAGPAGLSIAIIAAGLGAKVALVERNAMGGDCLNAGCVPSKAMLEFTRRHRGAEHFDAAFAWMRDARADIAHRDAVQRYAEAGVDVFLGAARFVDEQTLQVRDQIIKARRITVATGARPALPSIPGLMECEPLTNETVFDLKERPHRMAVIGAGATGCELAQVFARLGLEVHLIEKCQRVLPTQATEASRIVTRALQADGVVVHTGAGLDHVGRQAYERALRLDGESLIVDEILVTAGRCPNTEDLNLDVAGVEIDETGRIEVDRHLRTTNPTVYAAGDVCSAWQHTHNADAQARIVVQNALFAPTVTTARLIIPRCVYTDPEVAQLGKTRNELEAASVAFQTHRIEFAELDRARAAGERDGFAEVLVARGSDKILGATLVGANVSELIAPLCLAMRHELGLEDLADVVLPYPTRAEYLRKIADSHGRSRLTSLAARGIQAWLRWRA